MFKRIDIRILAAVFIWLLICQAGSAEIIALKSGKTVKGKILERGDKHIVVDLGVGVELTFYLDEIADISAEISAKASPSPKASNVAPSPQAAPVLKETLSSPQKIAEKKVFLWRVQSGKAMVYLFGSVHIGKKEFYPLDNVIEKAFDESDTLVLEIDITQVDPQEAQEQMLAHALYPQGENLQDHISDRTLIKLQKRLQQYGLSLSQFMQFKPWFVGMSLTKIQLQRLGFNERYGVEFYFINQLGKKGTMALETLEEQIGLFDSFPHQDELLEQSLVSQEEVDKVFGKIIGLWQKGDARALDQLLIQDGIKENPHLKVVYQKLFFDRNRNMVEKIKEFFNEAQTFFVVVGAGHLVGEEGIVQLLKNEGYAVEQL